MATRKKTPALATSLPLALLSARPRISPDDEAAIDSLFEFPPDDDDEIRDALADVAPDAARALLLDRLRAPATERWASGLTGAALRVLGAPPIVADLVAILGDRSLTDHARYAALTALESLPPEQFLSVFSTLPPAASEAAMTLPMVAMVAAVQEDPEAGRDVATMLIQLNDEVRPSWLMELGQVRRQVGVRAADLYRHALAEPAIARDDRLRELMLLGIIEEADEAGSALLQELRAKAPKSLRASFQAALLKLETARANGGGAKVADGLVEAFASNPDGQGAVVVFASFRNPDGSFTIANLALRLTEDLRNGFVEPRATRADLDRMVGEFSDDGSITPIAAPPGEVARLVAEAAARTVQLRGAIPTELRRAVELFARIPSAEPPPVAPARSLAVSTLRTLFARPLHKHWFFDPSDLARFGATSLRPGASADQRAVALDALARSPMRARCIAMARYMSRWASWRGDDGEAGHWTTLAEAAERDFAISPLVTVMAVLTLNPDAFAELVATALPARSAPAPAASAGGLEAFSLRFPKVAAAESRTIVLEGYPMIPDDAYELWEFYCVDPGCDCNRVLLKVIARSNDAEVATIGHGFDAKQQSFTMNIPRTYLDPLHPRAPFAQALLALVEDTLRTDAAWHQRLQRHYQMVKQALKPVPVRRVGPKVGPNEKCPCGSGKKFKKCCG